MTPGRICLSLTALATSITPYLADWSPSHIFNPRWPPHAKFHNGQTMSLGLTLGIATAYYTWRDTTKPKDSLRTAAIFGCLYYLAGLSAILYPGAMGTDPEFGEGFPQAWLFAGLVGLPWLGVWLG